MNEEYMKLNSSGFEGTVMLEPHIKLTEGNCSVCAAL